MIDYHDHEWGQRQTNTRKLFEMLCLEIFQAGLSWETILKRRFGMRQALYQFYPDQLASLAPIQIEQLLMDARIIRNRRKVEAIIHNANIVATMTETFSQYLDRIVPLNQTDEVKLVRQVVKQMKADGFKFIGPNIINSFLEATGYFHHHQPTCFAYRAGVDTVSAF
ncbi:MAG: DNA-3-methyladenine glycosylase I [Aerococcus sp.]|nr:DNA-3-methyladenine glycosylase I [Aerococcus sp.]